MHVARAALAIVTPLSLFACRGSNEHKRPVPLPSASEVVVAPPEPPKVPAAGDFFCKDDASNQTSGGRITACTLAYDRELNRVLCAAEKTAAFHPNGVLRECTAKDTVSLDGFTCRETVLLYSDGRLKRCRLSEGRRVSPQVETHERDLLTLYPAGALKELAFADRAKVKGFACKLVVFHEDGQVKRCDLTEVTKVQGATFRSGDSVCFDDKGKVADCKSLTFDEGLN
jgi:hypothetical protein